MEEEKEAEEKLKRPRRTMKPSMKAVEKASLPTDESETTTCSDFEDM